MHLLRGAVRTYAWGSRTAIADFVGAPSPTPHPEAELWFGAHPAAPATVGGTGLDEVIEHLGFSRSELEAELHSNKA